ncbi:MAG: ATP-binding cassette domain-containing protein [Sphaerochaetaceae bacterium]|nr:ATP-binding cassette domain-containing protein [Sphaerochaetaceae bacterium]
MLEIKNISKTFNPGTINEKKVFSDFSLTVKDSEFVTIIGANGAGKSTLFNAISGTFFTDSGTILLDGKNITLMSEYKRSRRIGRLFQDPMLGTAPGMTIEENLALAAGRGGWFSTLNRQDRERFKEKLSELGMGLEDKLTKPVGLLSGGQRQALTLMMATINPPDLLLLDEHTAALDPATAEKVLKITNDIVTKYNLTCLMVTHNMQSALDFGNRILMMDDGKVVFDACGEEKKNLKISDLLVLFRKGSGKALNTDRILLS